MVSSGMLRRVARVRTDVSAEPGTSFFRATRIGELGTTLAVTSNRRTLRSTTRRNIPEDTILHSTGCSAHKLKMICSEVAAGSSELHLPVGTEEDHE
jgi:hypothetical protein